MTEPPRSRPLLAAQLGVVLAAPLPLAAPPAQGAMLLVPLGAGAERRMLTAVLDQETSIVGAGPVAGSLVVRGRRDRLLGAMLGAGVLVLAAPAAGCSPEAGR